MNEEINNNAKKVIEIIDSLKRNKVSSEGLNNILQQLLKENK